MARLAGRMVSACGMALLLTAAQGGITDHVEAADARQSKGAGTDWISRDVLIHKLERLGLGHVVALSKDAAGWRGQAERGGRRIGFTADPLGVAVQADAAPAPP